MTVPTYCYFAIIALFLISICSSASAIDCYFGSSTDRTDPNLPNNTQINNCSNSEGICYKAYTLMTYVMPGDDETLFQYEWGCTDQFNTLNKFIACGSTFEDSYGGPYTGANVTSYYRLCTCCGDLCNNHTMDEECNDTPVFTKTCLTAGRTESTVNHPDLPIDALKISCTNGQSCYKASQIAGDDKAESYYWGCASTLGHQCGVSANFTDDSGDYYKVCTCCGNNCNDARMNSVLATSLTCDIVTSTTVITSPGTTEVPLPPAPNDSTAAVVGGVLGSLLFLSFLVIGYMGFTLYKLKNGGEEVRGLINISSNRNDNKA